MTSRLIDISVGEREIRHVEGDANTPKLQDTQGNISFLL
jgi:hypothetical protein